MLYEPAMRRMSRCAARGLASVIEEHHASIAICRRHRPGHHQLRWPTSTRAGAAIAQCETLPIPQVVKPGVVEPRDCCRRSSICPGPNEQPAGSLKLPWDANRDFCVGEFARNFGSQVPTRLVASAKSWLCHAGVDRRAADPAVEGARGRPHGLAARGEHAATSSTSPRPGTTASPRTWPTTGSSSRTSS